MNHISLLGMMLFGGCSTPSNQDTSITTIRPKEGYWGISAVEVLRMECTEESDEEPYSMMKDIEDFALTVDDETMTWRFPNNYQNDCSLDSNAFRCNTITSLSDSSFALTWDFSGSIISPSKMDIQATITIDCYGDNTSICRSNFPLYPCTWLEKGILLPISDG